nr:uncharacterized protein LOC112427863 [Macaca nemestrina]
MQRDFVEHKSLSESSSAVFPCPPFRLLPVESSWRDAREGAGCTGLALASGRPGLQHGSRNLRPVFPFLGTKERSIPPTQAQVREVLPTTSPRGRGSLGWEEQLRPPPPARRPALCSPGRKAASCPPAASKRAPSCPINPPGTDNRLATASSADKTSRNHHSLFSSPQRAAPPTPGPTHLPAGRPGSGTPAVPWSRANGRALPAGPRASRLGARGPSRAPSPSQHTRASVRHGLGPAGVGHPAMTARRSGQH